MLEIGEKLRVIGMSVSIMTPLIMTTTKWRGIHEDVNDSAGDDHNGEITFSVENDWRSEVDDNASDHKGDNERGRRTRQW